MQKEEDSVKSDNSEALTFEFLKAVNKHVVTTLKHQLFKILPFAPFWLQNHTNRQLFSNL